MPTNKLTFLYVSLRSRHHNRRRNAAVADSIGRRLWWLLASSTI